MLSPGSTQTIFGVKKRCRGSKRKSLKSRDAYWMSTRSTSDERRTLPGAKEVQPARNLFRNKTNFSTSPPFNSIHRRCFHPSIHTYTYKSAKPLQFTITTSRTSGLFDFEKDCVRGHTRQALFLLVSSSSTYAHFKPFVEKGGWTEK